MNPPVKEKPAATPIIITVIEADMMSIIPALHANGLNPKNKKTINPLQQPTIPWVAAGFSFTGGVILLIFIPFRALTL